MGGNIQNVGFMSPQAILAPDLSVEQQQIQRQQALAQALRQQALSPTDGGRGPISWTQGVERLFNAFAARGMTKQADKQQAALNQAMAGRMGSMFGSYQAPQVASPQSQSAAPQNDMAPSDGGALSDHAASVSRVADAMRNAGVSVPQEPSAGGSADPSAPAAAPSPMPGSVGGGAATPQGQYVPGPMSLTGNPGQDMSMYAMNPDEYTKQVIASHAPVDMAKLTQQAQAALARGDFTTAQALLGSITKQNYIAPITGRPGVPIHDPLHPDRILAMTPQNIEGANPVIGQDGRWTGAYAPAPGAAAAMQTAASAKSFGGAGGELVQIYNPATGQMEYRPKQGVLQGGVNGSGVAAGAPMGAQAAFNVTGQNSANAFQGISDGAKDVGNRVYALKQMAALVADPKTVTGPGSATAATLAGRLNTFGQSLGLDINLNRSTVSNAQEFTKWANQYSARSAAELGLSGSDKRTEIAIHATPNGEMTKQALNAVIPQMLGIEQAKQAHAQAAASWQQRNGPQTFQQFQVQWNKAYDPRVFTWRQTGVPKDATQAQRDAVARSYLMLKGMGAL